MRVVVAMSGGVDSSVAAALLADQGHEVIGVSMQLYDQTEGVTSFGSCCSIDDLHDARPGRDPASGRFWLGRGADARKDQSYFLFSLTQTQLAHAIFPVGDRPKEVVRDYARARRLPVADKPDSQEICFIPDHDYAG